jgi:hypothetical protein
LTGLPTGSPTQPPLDADAFSGATVRDRAQFDGSPGAGQWVTEVFVLTKWGDKGRARPSKSYPLDATAFNEAAPGGAWSDGSHQFEQPH